MAVQECGTGRCPQEECLTTNVQQATSLEQQIAQVFLLLLMVFKEIFPIKRKKRKIQKKKKKALTV